MTWKTQLKKAVKRAMAKTSIEYIKEVDKTIKSTTEFIPGQDIIDTGNLLRSLQASIKQDSGRIIIQYAYKWAPVNPKNGFAYAVAVWMGYFAFGRKFIPPRPWDTRAAKNLRVVHRFATNLKAEGVKVTRVVSNLSSLPG